MKKGLMKGDLVRYVGESAARRDGQLGRGIILQECEPVLEAGGEQVYEVLWQSGIRNRVWEGGLEKII